MPSWPETSVLTRSISTLFSSKDFWCVSESLGFDVPVTSNILSFPIPCYYSDPTLLYSAGWSLFLPMRSPNTPSTLDHHLTPALARQSNIIGNWWGVCPIQSLSGSSFFGGFCFETGYYCVTQAFVKLMGTSDLPAVASKAAGTTGVSSYLAVNVTIF